MKYVVLNGSPKGDPSVTMQFIRFLERKFRFDFFDVINISHNISSIESGGLKEVIDKMNSADGIIWAYPVYHFTIPAQYLRFIELLYSNQSKLNLKNIYSTAISTSVHFYDNYAESFIRDVSFDFGLRYVRGFLASRYDLLDTNKSKQFTAFFERYTQYIERGWQGEFLTSAVSNKQRVKLNVDFDQISTLSTSKSFLLITDGVISDTNLWMMVELCKACLGDRLKVYNLDELNIKSACLGCIHCAKKSVCAINDELTPVLVSEVERADGIIFASKVKERYISTLMKTFWDRSFLHGHRRIFEGKSILFLCSGPFRQAPLVQQDIEARLNVFGGNLVSIVHDDLPGEDQLLDQLMGALESLVYSVDNGIELPRNFLGVAGQKIARDMVYLGRSVYQENHLYYKKRKLYDYPHFGWRERLKSVFGALLIKFKLAKKESINERMLKELRKVIDDVQL